MIFEVSESIKNNVEVQSLLFGLLAVSLSAAFDWFLQKVRPTMPFLHGRVLCYVKCTIQI